MLMVPKSEAEIETFGNNRGTHKVIGRIQTSDSDPRTGTCHQMRVTAGNTACNVNAVLGHIRSVSQDVTHVDIL